MEKNEEGVYPRILGYLKELSHPQGRGPSQLLWPNVSLKKKKKVSLYVAYFPFCLMGNPWKTADRWFWTLRRQT